LTFWALVCSKGERFLPGAVWLKREFRWNRKRARRCDRGQLLQDATVINGKAQHEDDPKVRRPAW